ncbi:MAG: 4a-hydroxytetrahydrobiopterin dehydratase [Acidobacteria bacterium]|nr:4a-hydroxytetrahydrobiopterin dehydratase [Acidobacteriota bacterium]
MPTLNQAEIAAYLTTDPGWKLDSGKLVREWSFSTFTEAIGFVNKVADLAESAGHHPDIDVRYNKVQLSLVSHDAGGITKRDIKMAARISDVFGRT